MKKSTGRPRQLKESVSVTVRFEARQLEALQKWGNKNVKDESLSARSISGLLRALVEAHCK